MIHIKTEKELEKMRVAGRLTAIARKAAADAVKPGVTTWEIDLPRLRRLPGQRLRIAE